MKIPTKTGVQNVRTRFDAKFSTVRIARMLPSPQRRFAFSL
jgi:hypothetical protein